MAHASRRPRHRGAKPGSGKSASGYPRFWGKHAVYAALDNPDRQCRKIWGTHAALAEIVIPDGLPVQFCEVADLARLIPGDAPHQGLVLEVEPQTDHWLGDVMDADPKRPLIILDQVTDPQNIGAVLRSAAAFNAAALITQDRHAPPESGVVAKAASGALEIVPWVRVVNLSRALEEISEAGYWRVGLTGHTDTVLDQALVAGPMAIVLGAEGEGMRQNVMGHCDQLAKLPISAAMESLNVSNAAAIALYAIATR